MPPNSITGGKLTSQFAGVRFDWARFVCPSSVLQTLLEEFREEWGDCEACRGRFNRTRGVRFGVGISLHWNDGGDECGGVVVEVPGAVAEAVGAGGMVFLVRWLGGLGGRPTRLDVAVDLWDAGGLIEAVHASCKAGELCGARVFRRVTEEGADGVLGDMVCIGRRGKDGSGRYLRVYDKGLETGVHPLGKWTRWEAEFADECAVAVLELVREVEGWEGRLLSTAFGVCEFRENNGSEHIDRRPLAAWWAEFAGGMQTVRVRQTREKTTAEGWRGWVRTAVVPSLLAAAAALGVTVDHVIRVVGAGVAPSERFASSAAGQCVLSVWHGETLEGESSWT